MPLEERFREVMRRYPTGVTVVTSYIGGKPHGLTVNSFTSISIRPPLVGVFITRGTTGHRAIKETGAYAVNILRYGQEAIAKRFAEEPPDRRFEGIGWSRTRALGLPAIEGSLAYIEARVSGESDIADHTLFIGEVVNAEITSESEPLVYYMRGYRRILLGP